MLTYANSLSGPFIFDDRATVLDNASIRDLRNIGAVLAPPTETPVAGRPLVNATFAINYALDGLDVAGYHVVNIALHLLCAALVFAIVRRTMTSLKPETRFQDYGDDLAFASALIWVVHPLNSEVVNYLSITEHLDDFTKGILDTKHIVYYASFITFGLFLTAKSVDSERWRG